MPLLIVGIALAGFTALLVLGYVGEASYVLLVAGTALVGLVLHGFGRLQEIDLKNLKLVLRELKETKEELFVKQQQLKSLATPLAQIIAFSSAAEGRMTSKEFFALRAKWYRKKIKELVDALGIEYSEALETRKYLEKYEEIDKTLGTREGLQTTDPDYQAVKQRLAKLNEELNEMLRADIEKQNV